MGCNCGKPTTWTYQVRADDGTIRQYQSEAEARAAARHGGTFEMIRK